MKLWALKAGCFPSNEEVVCAVERDSKSLKPFGMLLHNKAHTQGTGEWVKSF